MVKNRNKLDLLKNYFRNIINKNERMIAIMIMNMNKLERGISKIDICFGLLFCIVISILSLKVAMVFFIGVIVALINYLVRATIIRKFLLGQAWVVVLSSCVRIILISVVVIPFINDVKLIFAYLIGFLLHYISTVYCSIYRKGSA